MLHVQLIGRLICILACFKVTSACTPSPLGAYDNYYICSTCGSCDSCSAKKECRGYKSCAGHGKSCDTQFKVYYDKSVEVETHRDCSQTMYELYLNHIPWHNVGPRIPVKCRLWTDTKGTVGGYKEYVCVCYSLMDHGDECNLQITPANITAFYFEKQIKDDWQWHELRWEPDPPEVTRPRRTTTYASDSAYDDEELSYAWAKNQTGSATSVRTGKSTAVLAANVLAGFLYNLPVQ